MIDLTNMTEEELTALKEATEQEVQKRTRGDKFKDLVWDAAMTARGCGMKQEYVLETMAAVVNEAYGMPENKVSPERKRPEPTFKEPDLEKIKDMLKKIRGTR